MNLDRWVVDVLDRVDPLTGLRRRRFRDFSFALAFEGRRALRPQVHNLRRAVRAQRCGGYQSGHQNQSGEHLAKHFAESFQPIESVLSASGQSSPWTTCKAAKTAR